MSQNFVLSFGLARLPYVIRNFLNFWNRSRFCRFIPSVFYVSTLCIYLHMFIKYSAFLAFVASCELLLETSSLSAVAYSMLLRTISDLFLSSFILAVHASGTF